MRQVVGVLLAIASNTGCALQELPRLPQGATLLLTPQVPTPGLATQAVVSPYRRQDIHHLVLTLFRLDGGTEVAVTGAGGAPITLDVVQKELDATLTIGQLRSGTAYRVRTYAYKAPGTASADLISAAGSASCTDLTILSDDRPTLAPLIVKLVDRPFGASTRVTLTASGLAAYSAILLQLKGPTGTTVATRSVPVEQVPGTCAFSHLQGATTYRLDAQALNMLGQPIPGATQSLAIAIGDDTELATMSLVVPVAS